MNDLDLILAHRGRVFGLARDYTDGQGAGTHSHVHGQLLHALSGIILAETPQRLWAVPASRVLWIPPRVRHGFETQGRTRVRTVYVPEDATAQLPETPAALSVSPLARALIERASIAAGSRLGGFTERAVALLLEELAAAGDASVSLSLALPSSARTLDFARYVTAHPDDRAPLDALARRFGMSAKTLSRRMAAETGLTPEVWRQRSRLLEALARLELGDAIARVAVDVGYASASSFGAAFRRTFGITPAQAQKNRDPETAPAASARGRALPAAVPAALPPRRG